MHVSEDRVEDVPHRPFRVREDRSSEDDPVHLGRISHRLDPRLEIDLYRFRHCVALCNSRVHVSRVRTESGRTAQVLLVRWLKELERGMIADQIVQFLGVTNGTRREHLLIIFGALTIAVAVVRNSQAQLSHEIALGTLEGLDATPVVVPHPDEDFLGTPSRSRPETFLPEDSFPQRTQIICLKVVAAEMRCISFAIILRD